MAFIGEHDDGPFVVLVFLGKVVDSHHDRCIGNGQLGVVAFPGKRREIHDGHIGIGPGFTVCIKNLTLEPITEHTKGFAHLEGPHSPVLRIVPVFVDHPKAVSHIRGHGSPTGLLCFSGTIENGIPDHSAVCAGQLFRLLLFAPGDHERGDNFHLTHDVTLVITIVIGGCVLGHHHLCQNIHCRFCPHLLLLGFVQLVKRFHHTIASDLFRNMSRQVLLAD